MFIKKKKKKEKEIVRSKILQCVKWQFSIYFETQYFEILFSVTNFFFLFFGNFCCRWKQQQIKFLIYHHFIHTQRRYTLLIKSHTVGTLINFLTKIRPFLEMSTSGEDTIYFSKERKYRWKIDTLYIYPVCVVKQLKLILIVLTMVVGTYFVRFKDNSNFAIFRSDSFIFFS